MTRTLAAATCVAAALVGCGGRAERRGATILYASGADLESINPLLTGAHPLARQVQKFLLLTTLARYDSALRPVPYLARGWSWAPDRRTLTLRVRDDVRWHDGRRTTARDAAWTIAAARDPAVGYARANELADLADVTAPSDTTLVLTFAAAPSTFPDVLTDLAILPAHLLDSVPRDLLRRAAWNRMPVGNGPFRFAAHQPNRRWVFVANRAFPAALGGPPAIERFIVVVVDEPMTKIAALSSGELDVAGISPAHAAFVRRDPALAVLDYPVIFVNGVVFNMRRAPLNDARVRRAISLALDRREVVDGFGFGFGTPAFGPVPPDLPAAAPPPAHPRLADSARRLLGGRRVRFDVLTVGSAELALEQLVQAQLARVGVDVAIRQLQLSTFLDRVYGERHDFTAAIMGVPGDPGLGYLGVLGRITGLPMPRDPAAAQRLFADSTPVAFLYFGRGLQGISGRLRGVTMDARGELVTAARWRVGP